MLHTGTTILKCFRGNSSYVRVITSNSPVCKQNNFLLSSYFLQNRTKKTATNTRSGGNFFKTRHGSSTSAFSRVFKEVFVEPHGEGKVGEELSRPLTRGEILDVLTKFYHQREIRELLSEMHNLDDTLQHRTYVAFRKYCERESLPVDLHLAIVDILAGAGKPVDILPFFVRFAQQLFPHLEHIDNLKAISDLTNPPNWYAEARAMRRKVVFHKGPTNSGKTYHALKSFINAESGVYCGPLKMLATEVFNKCNKEGTSCDLVTGEEKIFGNADSQSSSKHVACTVEMTSLINPYDVAVIDEIQMIKDYQRGWAWTRAFLGVLAKEVHVCGEEATENLLKELCAATGDDLTVIPYERKTPPLKIEDSSLSTLENIQPGDCIVCFSKKDIYTVAKTLETLGKDVAVIYGSLPPGTKLAQASKFNDPEHKCKVLVATDAIGMGLNLSIRRVIFYSLMKPNMNEKGERESQVISVSQALQIAGRAGRFGSQWEQGHVTTFRAEDLKLLQQLLEQKPDVITQAGLHPTFEQIEMYGIHLPKYNLDELIDIFVILSTLDHTNYFMCNMEDFKFLAEMINHIPLSLKVKYIFCCAPINRKMPFVCSLFRMFAVECSKKRSITWDWLSEKISWPVKEPYTIADLVHLEAVFDVLDLYLWFSYRFIDQFPEGDLVRAKQRELDLIIQEGVRHITKLIKNTDSGNLPLNSYDDIEYTTARRAPAKDVSQGSSAPFVSDCSVPIVNLFEPKYVTKGRLTEQLLAEGRLTPSLVQQLQKEWGQEKPAEVVTAKHKKLSELRKLRRSPRSGNSSR